MKKEFEGRFLGVLGGMGPMAGAFFLQRLIALTPAQRDQDHIPTILWSDPRIPDRPSAFLGRGEDPLPWFNNAIATLIRSGAEAIAIPCNTAHLWHRQMTESTERPVLHIARAVIEDLRRRGIHSGRIGLMATEVTLNARMYQDLLEGSGYECVTPDAAEVEEYCSTPIRLVKQNRIAESFEPVARCVDLLGRRGADAVVLGCTELPVALPHSRRPELAVPVLDSIDALALAAIDWHRSGHAPRVKD